MPLALRAPASENVGVTANDTVLLAEKPKNAIGVSETPIARGMRAAEATAGSPPGSELPNVTVTEEEPLVAAGKVVVPEMPAAIVPNVAPTADAPALRTCVAEAGAGVGVGAGVSVGVAVAVAVATGIGALDPPPPPPQLTMRHGRNSATIRKSERVMTYTPDGSCEIFQSKA